MGKLIPYSPYGIQGVSLFKGYKADGVRYFDSTGEVAERSVLVKENMVLLFWGEADKMCLQKLLKTARDSCRCDKGARSVAVAP